MICPMSDEPKSKPSDEEIQRAGEILRKAAGDSGETAYKLAKSTGIPIRTISDFLAGKDMGLGRALILARYLGLELRPKEPGDRTAADKKPVAKKKPAPKRPTKGRKGKS